MMMMVMMILPSDLMGCATLHTSLNDIYGHRIKMPYSLQCILGQIWMWYAKV